MVENLRDGSAWFHVSWEERPYRFGRGEFRVRGHGIGRLRGRQIADLPIPIRAGRVPVAEDKAEPHTTYCRRPLLLQLLPPRTRVCARPRGALLPELRAARRERRKKAEKVANNEGMG